MKRLHEEYVELVRSGPPGLFSRGDTSRLEQHVADGCTGAAVLDRLAARSVVDVGSGGGVPGLQLAIELTAATVHLVESQQWKAAFLHATARALNLDSRVRVHPQRVEDVEAAVGGRESCDAGTARALAAPIVVAEYLSPLVRPGGVLLLWSTAAQATTPAVAANELLGLGDPIIHPAPSELRAEGVLIEWPKQSPCSTRFPRRIGVAARKPLA